jgi:hypothetical protein
LEDCCTRKSRADSRRRSQIWKRLEVGSGAARAELCGESRPSRDRLARLRKASWCLPNKRRCSHLRQHPSPSSRPFSIIVELDISILSQSSFPQILAVLLQNVLQRHTLIREYLQMIRYQMPVLATRTCHQRGPKMICLLGDTVRRPVQTFAACEGHFVGGFLRFAGGDFIGGFFGRLYSVGEWSLGGGCRFATELVEAVCYGCVWEWFALETQGSLHGRIW